MASMVRLIGHGYITNLTNLSLIKKWKYIVFGGSYFRWQKENHYELRMFFFLINRRYLVSVKKRKDIFITKRWCYRNHDYEAYFQYLKKEKKNTLLRNYSRRTMALIYLHSVLRRHDRMLSLLFPVNSFIIFFLCTQLGRLYHILMCIFQQCLQWWLV